MTIHIPRPSLSFCFVYLCLSTCIYTFLTLAFFFFFFDWVTTVNKTSMVRCVGIGASDFLVQGVSCIYGRQI